MPPATKPKSAPKKAKQNVGRIEEIQGVVIEAVFHERRPEINHAIIVKRGSGAEVQKGIAAAADDYLVCEVQQHLGDDRVRAVAMDSTDGRSDGSSTCSAKRSIWVSSCPRGSSVARSTRMPRPSTS